MVPALEPLVSFEEAQALTLLDEQELRALVGEGALGRPVRSGGAWLLPLAQVSAFTQEAWQVA